MALNSHRSGLIRHCLRTAVLLLGLLVMAAGFAGSLVYVPETAVSLPAPDVAADAQAVAIDLTGLFTAVEPESISVELADGQYLNLVVMEQSTYINGDRMLRAQGAAAGQPFSLSLTIGEGHLFGYLSSSLDALQIYAAGQADIYYGWQYHPQGLANLAGDLHNDFFIPDVRTLSPISVQSGPRLPLQLSNTTSEATPNHAAASTAGITTTNLRITQNFDRTNVFVGGSVNADIAFENISSQSHTNLYVEVYFLLENSTLESASTSCREQLSLSLQKVLYCELGNFAVGEVKHIDYRIGVDAQSRPRVISTAVVGNARVDATINVVADVRSDSDGDGISDYNENLAGTDPDNAASADYGDTVIDVMAFYTAGTRAAYPLGVETRINQLISVANQVYADSGVNLRLRPVYHGEVAYSDSADMDTALDAIIYKTDPAFSNVDALREIYGGDLVMLLRPLGDETSRCGLAPVGGYNTNGDFSAATEKQFAFAAIGIDCPSDIVVAHELGHSMGLTHSHVEDGSGGTFDFATGYGVEGQFATVMALPAAFNSETRVAQFSNPRLQCLGFVCGVAEGQPLPADAAQALNIAKYQIANYYPATVPDMPRSLVTTLSGKPTTAKISMAASHDNGLSFDNLVTPDYYVDMLAEITVDDAHVGASGNIYVLVSLADGQIYQISSTGNFVKWDGTAAGLVAIASHTTLHKLERLSLLDGFQFDAALVGLELQVYIAYEVSDIGEFVYTTTPLVVRVQSAQ